MQIVKLFFSVLMVITLASCSGGSGVKDPLLTEAFSYYKKSSIKEKDIEKGLKFLEKQKNAIQVKGHTLTGEETQLLENISSLGTQFETWKKNKVEVAGFEHDHDHSKCTHDHHAHPKVTPKQMLDIQKESFETIKKISEEVNTLTGKKAVEDKVIPTVLPH